MIAARDSHVLWAIPFLFAMCLAGSPAHAQYGGGTGTPNDPYLIYTAEQLNEIGLHEEDWDKHFKLMADIDLAGFSYSKPIIASVKHKLIWGYLDTAFTGVFDGNGHTISNLTIEGVSYVGLFGQLQSGAEVRDLGIVDVNVSGSYSYVGSLVGHNWSGNVIHCYSVGKVSGERCVGGLVGYNCGFMTQCHSEGFAHGHYNVGGLVGYNQFPGNMTDCYSTVTVSGNDQVGGLVGANFSNLIRCRGMGSTRGATLVGGLVGGNLGDVTNCYSSSTVNGDLSVGGLIGKNFGDVTTCSSIATVIGGENVGGLVGISNEGIIINCISEGTVNGRNVVGGLVGLNNDALTGGYSTSVVDGDQIVGGLVGDNRGDIKYTYSTGAASGDYDVGGLVGSNHGRVTHSYSTGAASGTMHVGGLIGENRDSVICSYSISTVDGSNEIGGFVGANRGPIHNCYARGHATGSRRIGGLVGYNHTGTISNCYSVGLITGEVAQGGLVGFNESGHISNSFWDIQTSGQITSAGGIGNTTSEMEMAGTFLGAGWDFVDETANGTENIWWILEGQHYPELAWGFWAFSPCPLQGATGAMQPLTLNWIAGNSHLLHDVYFGDDEETVGNATIETPGLYRGRQPAEIMTYDPGTLEWRKTYYWRIDAVDDLGAQRICKGKVWAFTTADHIVTLVVDDFESYSDNDSGSDKPIWVYWRDGWDNGTGSQVGYIMPPYAETVIVHGGHQSMPLSYDNDGTVDLERPGGRTGIPFYSEAVRTFESPWNWTINHTDTLTFFFRGEADNDPDNLYVGIEDSAGRIAVATYSDVNALLTTEWQNWHISLANMQAAGVDLTSVLKIYIGVGDRDNPQPGGSGKVYIDDIWIANRMP